MPSKNLTAKHHLTATLQKSARQNKTHGESLEIVKQGTQQNKKITHGKQILSENLWPRVSAVKLNRA
jgi:hypothetical protein